MKKNILPAFLIGICSIWTTTASAQMFYNARSNFDTTGATSTTYNQASAAKDEESKEEAPFEKIVSKGIRERIRSDAAYIIGEPDETICYGIARKSPKKRSVTIDGYAHTGNCGTLNETGMAEIQNKLFNEESYDMNISKIASCVITPKLALRFRKSFDFVDVILSGGTCPAVLFLYGGDTKEFSAKPIKDWLDTFIEAVSNDLEPINDEETAKKAGNMFKKRSPEEEEAEKEEEEEKKAAAAAPKMWGRRVVRPQEEETTEMESDPSVPPPPQ